MSVANETGKPVLHIRVEVTFQRPEEQAQEPPYAYYLDYGMYPFWYKPWEEYQTDKPVIAPGATVDIALSDDEYSSIKSTLMKLKYPTNQEGIEIRITTIGFADGSVWQFGSMYSRDPAAPRGWKKVEKQQGGIPRENATFR